VLRPVVLAAWAEVTNEMGIFDVLRGNSRTSFRTPPFINPGMRPRPTDMDADDMGGRTDSDMDDAGMGSRYGGTPAYQQQRAEEDLSSMTNQDHAYPAAQTHQPTPPPAYNPPPPDADGGAGASAGGGSGALGSLRTAARPRRSYDPNDLPRLPSPAQDDYDQFLLRQAQSRPGDDDSPVAKSPSIWRRIGAMALGGAAGYASNTPNAVSPYALDRAEEGILYGGSGEPERLQQIALTKASLAERATRENASLDDRMKLQQHQNQMEHWDALAENAREMTAASADARAAATEARNIATKEREQRDRQTAMNSQNALQYQIGKGDMIPAGQIPTHQMDLGMPPGGWQGPVDDNGQSSGPLSAPPSVPSLPPGISSSIPINVQEPGWNKFTMQQLNPDGSYKPLEMAAPSAERRAKNAGDMAEAKNEVDVPANQRAMFGGAAKVDKRIYDATLKRDSSAARDAINKEIQQGHDQASRARSGVMLQAAQLRTTIGGAKAMNPAQIQSSLNAIARMKNSSVGAEAIARRTAATAHARLASTQYQMSPEEYTTTKTAIDNAEKSAVEEVNKMQQYFDTMEQEVRAKAVAAANPNPASPAPGAAPGAEDPNAIRNRLKLPPAGNQPNPGLNPPPGGGAGLQGNRSIFGR